MSVKDKRRLEAEERNRLAKIRNTLKKELAAVEEKITALEARKTVNEQALCDPQVHRDGARIRDLQIDLKTVEDDLEDAYSRWTELSCRLEEET